MGSIQALRSQALASRAKEDTSLQISGYLGTVNKSLGGQISNLIDQLQGVISERTKAYNAIMSGKVKKAIEGKGGVGEVAVKQAFALTRGVVAAVVTIASGGKTTEIISAGLNIAAGWLALKGAQSTFKAACYDYERAASELGLNSREPTTVQINGSPVGVRTGGAVQLVNLRDQLMPRFKPLDPSIPFSTNFAVANGAERGYVGTLRRV